MSRGSRGAEWEEVERLVRLYIERGVLEAETERRVKRLLHHGAPSDALNEIMRGRSRVERVEE